MQTSSDYRQRFVKRFARISADCVCELETCEGALRDELNEYFPRTQPKTVVHPRVSPHPATRIKIVFGGMSLVNMISRCRMRVEGKLIVEKQSPF